MKGSIGVSKSGSVIVSYVLHVTCKFNYFSKECIEMNKQAIAIFCILLTVLTSCSQAPTATLMPTKTATVVKTDAPTKTSPPPTPTKIPAKCFFNCAEIDIVNDTGGLLIFSVSGVGESEWSLVVGTTTVKVNPGVYTIIATASCGIDTDEITVTEGMNEEITYYCTSIP